MNVAVNHTGESLSGDIELYPLPADYKDGTSAAYRSNVLLVSPLDWITKRRTETSYSLGLFSRQKSASQPLSLSGFNETE